MSAATLDEVLVDLPFPTGVPEQVRRRATLRLVASDPTPPARQRFVESGPPGASAPLTGPVRLTARGIAVLAALVVGFAVALVLVAWRSAPPAAGGSAVTPLSGRTVSVVPGDSLWTIALRVAPDVDPRAEVAVLQRLNGLAGAPRGEVLVPGQVLRIR